MIGIKTDLFSPVATAEFSKFAGTLSAALSQHCNFLGYEDLFLYSSSVYSCHLLISSASVRSIPFLSFIDPIFACNVPLVFLIFLKRSLLLLLLSHFSHV